MLLVEDIKNCKKIVLYVLILWHKSLTYLDGLEKVKIFLINKNSKNIKSGFTLTEETEEIININNEITEMKEEINECKRFISEYAPSYGRSNKIYGELREGFSL